MKAAGGGVIPWFCTVLVLWLRSGGGVNLIRVYCSIDGIILGVNELLGGKLSKFRIYGSMWRVFQRVLGGAISGYGTWLVEEVRLVCYY